MQLNCRNYKMKRKIVLFFLFLNCFLLFAEERRNEVVKAVEKVLPSVVNIGTETIVSSSHSPWGIDPFEGFFKDFFGHDLQSRTNSLGSGVIIDPAGLIITNAHVVYRATEINIVFYDGKVAKAVEIASDELNDIALLALITPVPDTLKPISIAPPDELYLGETVIAVGNPYGLGSSISRGILSALNREAIYQGKVIFSDILQTDAAIKQGNSGGPLVNILGEMIGLNTAIYKDAQGIGFAIPVKRIESVVGKWLIPERFSKTSLGIIPGIEQTGKYFIISEVLPGSPAEKSGLKPGTKISHINGNKFKDLISLGRELWKIKPGIEISLKSIDGKEWKLKTEELKLFNGQEIAQKRLSLSLIELDKSLAKSIDYPFAGGLIVSELSPSNGDSEVRRGDVLVRLNDIRINNFDDIVRAMKNVLYGQRVRALFLKPVKRGNAIYIIRKEVILEAK